MPLLSPRYWFCILGFSVLSAWAHAQPATPAADNPRAPANLVSPEVGSDRRVTFRMFAPKAGRVSVSGQWDNNTRHEMTKDAQGIWSITVGPIEPSFWIYNFTMDGVDLADPINPQVKLRVRTSGSLLDVRGERANSWDIRNDIPHGTVETVWHNSEVTGDARSFCVYTPPGYDPAAATRYPVLYLLHGNGGLPSDWTAAGRANFMADSLISAQRIVPMIIVMPWGHTVPPAGPRGQNDPLFDRYLTTEIIPAVEKKYRVATGSANRAIMGLSMGGGQALKTGLGHLDIFAYVGGYSAATIGDFDERFKALLEDAPGTNAKVKLLWIGCGRQDSLFSSNEKMDSTLTARQIRHTFVARDGYHDYFFWRRCFEETTALLFR